MKLSFLGKTYTPATPDVEVTETEQTLTFLGRKSQVKQYTVDQRQPQGEELKFLGRRYSR
ncbi:MAG TPA: DUF4278 domain-containing protein [Leptolyngbyaceae cyanobacterium M65_K2018_010]|nr:DUF4278 domain-containing protein [Leptolyngbyaceae cyanobacterium M65_K2018_010]HIK45779.1 DUF4278 domain-containing protein [Leptolyngbyaceae cyanobacterium M65_K2018_010]